MNEITIKSSAAGGFIITLMATTNETHGDRTVGLVRERGDATDDRNKYFNRDIAYNVFRDITPLSVRHVLSADNSLSDSLSQR